MFFAAAVILSDQIAIWLFSFSSRSSLSEVVSEFGSKLWMASVRQRCPLVRLAYVDIVRLIRGHCSGAFLTQLSSQLLQEIHRTPNILEVLIPVLWSVLSWTYTVREMLIVNVLCALGWLCFIPPKCSELPVWGSWVGLPGMAASGQWQRSSTSLIGQVCNRGVWLERNCPTAGYGESAAGEYHYSTSLWPLYMVSWFCCRYCIMTL